MASNIGTNAAFATANMKPASSEQGDALWAQNVADNTGHVYFREIPIPMYGAASAQNNVWMFTKRPSHNAIKWVGRGQHGTSGNQICYLRVWDHTGTVAAAGAGALLSATHTDAMVSNTLQRHDLDISSLANGSTYIFGFDNNNGPLTWNPQAVWMVHGSSATY
jgi:hypothetical protein